MSSRRRSASPGSRWVRGSLRLVAAALLVLVGTVAANAARPSPPPSARPATLQLSGEVIGLFPGGTSGLPLEVVNPHAFTIDVMSLSVTVGVAAAGCGSQHLVIDDLDAPVAVPARSTKTIMLGATLAPDAPDACQGATWPLTYDATATRS